MVYQTKNSQEKAQRKDTFDLKKLKVDQSIKKRVMLGALNIITSAPNILSEWTKMYPCENFVYLH